MPRAVITGTSLICPAGVTADSTFQACLAGRCAAIGAGLPAPMARIPLARLPEIPRLAACPWPEPSAGLAVLAAQDALAEAGLEPGWMRREQSAMVVATSKAGVLTAIACHEAMRQTLGQGGGDRKSATSDNHATGGGDQTGTVRARGGSVRLAGWLEHWAPSTPPAGSGNRLEQFWPWATPACALSALCQAYQPGGEISSVVMACAAGLAALAQGARLIADGRADTVLVVAADASIHPLFVGSFWRMGVLAKWSVTPGDACRPFAADRCGFVLSEGAGAIVLQASDTRNRKSEHSAVSVAGWATGSQGADLVRPQEAAEPVAGVISTMLRRSDWPAGTVDLVHAHGTATPAGDLTETQAIKTALGPAARGIPVIATKPITGHMLGVAGLAQAVLTVKAMQAGRIPPTANLRQSDPQCDLDYNPAGPRELDVRRAICIANGFGGGVAVVGLQRHG